MPHVPRRILVALFIATCVVCCAAAVGTSLQIVRIGLAATPPPSMLGAIGRLAGCVLPVALWPVAKRYIERATIFAFVLGAGASGLIGLGVRSDTLDVIRVVYHLFMFSFGAIAALGLVADTNAGRFATFPRNQ